LYTSQNCVFEKLEQEYNSLDFQFLFGIWSIIFKVSSLQIWCKSKVLKYIFNTLKPLVWIFFFVSNIFFPYQMCTIQIGEDLNIDGFYKKWNWKIENQVYSTFEYIWFKCIFGPKIYKFWGCAFNKSYSSLCG